MRKLVFTVALAAGTLAGSIAANAMPALSLPQADDGIVTVAGGCGPGGHRNFRGYCVPNRRAFYRRACPPGMHLNPYGRCRPNF